MRLRLARQLISAAKSILMCDGMQELLIVRFITLPNVMRWMPKMPHPCVVAFVMSKWLVIQQCMNVGLYRV